MLEALGSDRFWSCPQFIDSETTFQFLEWAQGLEKKGFFKRALVGKGDLKKQVTEVRSDQICWIDNFEGPEGALAFQVFDSLLNIARQELFMPIKRFECHLAKYEKGQFYKRHMDRHQKSPSRLLTVVIYLTDLFESEGGELIVYQKGKQLVSLQPRAGSIVVFDSQLEHEVRPALADRWSLTGWMRDDIHPGLIL